jgi:putative addiction module component (TIGR02574 family)
MTERVAEIAGKIKLLSAPEKTDLLRLLLQEIDGAADPDADEAWRVEIERRVKAIHNGEAALRAVDDE